MDEDDLLILNLVMTIAQCADPSYETAVEGSLYSCCRDVVNAKLASPATSIKRVTIALLVVCNDCKFTYQAMECCILRPVGLLTVNARESSITLLASHDSPGACAVQPGIY